MARMDVAAVAAVVISALSALACSDPPEPPARGGLSVAFNQPQDITKTCIAGGAYSSFGLGNPSPTNSDIGMPVISGEDDTEIACYARGNGEFRASLKAPNISFDLRGVVGQSASVSAYAPSASLNVNGTGCTTDLTPPYAYYKGEMHIGFECPNVTSPAWPGTACRLNGSLVVLRCGE